MSLYSRFAPYYERIFPLRQGTLEFLLDCLPTRGTILDIGCGSGHYAGALAAAGRTVLGIDLDSRMIDAAGREYPAADFRVLEMEKIAELQPPFTAAYCIGNVLPHLPAEDLPGFLESLRELIGPEGVWLVQTVNFDPILERERHDLPLITFPDDQLLFHRSYRRIAPGRLEFNTRLEKDRETIFSDRVELHPLPASEMIRRHHEAGLHLAGHWSDFSGSPYLTDVKSGSVYLFRCGI